MKKGTVMNNQTNQDAIDLVRQMIADGHISREIAAKYVPELKESDDERIRKRLLKIFREAQSTDNWGGLSTKDIIAWLEKQGERESVVVIPKFRVGDVIRHKGSTAEYTIESISGECYHGKGWGLHISGEDDYELVGQKPAWSEEDEDILNTIINHFKVDIECTDEDDTVRWLKHLKEKYTWKPSEEQLNALHWCVMTIGSTEHQVLQELLEQLEKLKE